MNKNEQINEIAKTLCDNGFCRRAEFVDCELPQGTYCKRVILLATRLYEAGYCKKSEVVDDFANRLKEYLDDFYTTDEDALLDTCGAIDDIAKEMKKN